MPCSSREPVDGDADGEDRGLRVLGEQQLLFGPFEAQAAQRLAERLVGLGERLAADRKRLGELLAHADFLGALTGKHTGNHRGRRLMRRQA